MGWKPVGICGKPVGRSERVVQRSVPGSRPFAVPGRLEGC